MSRLWAIWRIKLTSKLTVVAVDDFKLTSTAHDADPNVMLVLAIATQDFLERRKTQIEAFMGDLVVYGAASMILEDQ
jgi:hypothetical protein